MMSDIEQEKRRLKKKANVGVSIMVAGCLTGLLYDYEPGLLIASAMIVVGFLVGLPAGLRLRRIGTPISQSERKRRLWRTFGGGALIFLFWGIFYSLRTPHTHLVFFWGLITVMFVAVMIWSWYISKGWTE
jgi:hypothetical protein